MKAGNSNADISKAVSSVTEYIKTLQKKENQYSLNKEDIEKYYQRIRKEKISEISKNDLVRGKKYVDAFLEDEKAMISGQTIEQISGQTTEQVSGQISRRFYRGQYNNKYHLVPSIYRQNEMRKEGLYYHEMAVRSPEFFQGKSHLDRLVTMQHYDCPTRLLDVTSSPLVALYFACKNYGCPTCNKSEFGVVYVFSVLPQEVVYSDSSRAIMLSCLAKFSPNQKNELCSLAESNIDKGAFSKTDNFEYQDDIVEKFYQEVKKELPGFNRNIRPIDLLKPLFVQPDKTNSRITKQDGAFILCGLSNSGESAENNIVPTVLFKIYIKNQDEILNELDLLGINEASLFPELDKVAHYLKEQRAYQT